MRPRFNSNRLNSYRRFPEGWRERLVAFEGPGAEPGRGLCLEPHDCILVNLVRFDEKDVRLSERNCLA